jgi:hypothetical protein
MSNFSSHRLSELKKLADLRDSGLLTPEEFESEKERLMNLTETSASTTQSSLYVPGTHQQESIASSLSGVSIPGKKTIGQIALLVLRIYVAVMTVGMSEAALWIYRRVKSSKSTS